MSRQAHNQEIKQDNRNAIKKLILAAGMKGISRREVVKATGLSHYTVHLHTNALIECGKVERSSDTGSNTRYGPPGIWEHYQPIREKTARERERYGTKAYESIQELEAWANHVPVHLCVSANDVPPLGKPGIASVWELAA